MQPSVDTLSERNCSEDVLGNESSVARSNKPSAIPPEVLHTILGDAVSGHLDLLITEPRKDTSSQGASRLLRLFAAQQHGVVDDQNDCWQETKEKPPANLNTVTSLLSVSYLFRDVTLKILSDVFGIQRMADGRCGNFPRKC
jgi:hypothetical protein